MTKPDIFSLEKIYQSIESNHTETNTALVRSLVDVIQETCPAMAVVFEKYLETGSSTEREARQNKLQIASFSELLAGWQQGFSDDERRTAQPQQLTVLKYFLTEKATDDFWKYHEGDKLQLKAEILSYNQIAIDLIRKRITLSDAMTLADSLVATHSLKELHTDTRVLLTSFLEKADRLPQLPKALFLALFRAVCFCLDTWKSRDINRAYGQMPLREVLENPNQFMLHANIRRIAAVSELIDSLAMRTHGKLDGLTQYAREMFERRYAAGNVLALKETLGVTEAIDLGTDTVLIGFTNAIQLLIHASINSDFLESISEQQDKIIEMIDHAARVIRLYNDASPQAIVTWDTFAREKVEHLHQTLAPNMTPREFFAHLHVLAKQSPSLQRFANLCARQCTDAVQGEYNIPFSAAGVDPANTWPTFYENMDEVSRQYKVLIQNMSVGLPQIHPTAAEYIGWMVGYHSGLYCFDSSDFDHQREVASLAYVSAVHWHELISDDTEAQLTALRQIFHEAHVTNNKATCSLIVGVFENLRDAGFENTTLREVLATHTAL